MQALRFRHIRELFKNPYKTIDSERIIATPSTLNKIRSTMNQLCDYAMSKDLMTRNYSKETPIENNYVEKHHASFADEEMALLWEAAKANRYAKMIVFQCYMGWRPSEMLNIKRSDVDLEMMTIKGVSKTEAGRNRIVPIHSKIQNIFYEFWISSADSEWLFPSSPQKRKTHLNYDTYREIFKQTIASAGCPNAHTAHDCRKQFVTMAKKQTLMSTL